MKLITAPEEIDWWNWIGQKSIFLAGSIEQGLAPHWQQTVIDSLQDLNIVILNPRRKEWNPSWEQSIKNKNFKEQVLWEQVGLMDYSDFVFFYFAPDTKAPITLMELGLVATKPNIKKVIVCPDGYWRKGNIEVLCHRLNLNLYSSLDEGIQVVRNTIPTKVGETPNGPYGFMDK